MQGLIGRTTYGLMETADAALGEIGRTKPNGKTQGFQREASNRADESHASSPSATTSPQGDMISVQPMLTSPSRRTAAGQANA